MKKLNVILLIVLLSAAGGLFQRLRAQDQHLIDSLQTQLKQLQGERMELRNNAPGLRDSSIAKVLNALFIAYKNNNTDKAMDYAKQSLALCEQIGWEKGIANAYNSIGGVYHNQGNYPEALKNHFASLKIKEEIGDKRGVAVSYINIGNVYRMEGNYPEALKKYFASLKISEEIGNKSSILINYVNIGIIYEKQSNVSEAFKNFLAALKIAEEIGDKKGIGASYVNIGIVYVKQGKYAEALKNYFAALKIAEEIGDKRGIALAYNCIGTVYFSQGNYPEALKNFFAVLKISEEMRDKSGIADSYCNIGEIYTKLKRPKEGKAWLQKGLSLSREIGSKEFIKNCYSNLAVVDSALGNYKGAFENHKLYMRYKDSLFNEEKSRKITQQQMQLDFDKKQAIDSLKIVDERKINEIKFKQEKTQRYALYGGLVLVLLFAGLMFNRFRVTQKQKKIIEEHHKEITDSINYAERIQRSLLASKDLLNNNLNPVGASSTSTSLSTGASAPDNYFVFFKPKDVVSGDFYWASMLQNGRFALVTADSTGHGVPGAIMSILNIACLNEAVKEGHTSPADILNRTRKEIIEVLKRDGSAEGGKDGMDCSLLVFDFKNKKLTLAAANNPVWIVRSTRTLSGVEADVSTPLNVPEVIEIKPDKMPVGKHDKQDISFKQQEIDLQSGDVIYTLTDGFPDQFGGPNGKKFMSKNLRELLAANANLPMYEQKQLLETTFANWVGDLEQVDDVTLIGVRV